MEKRIAAILIAVAVFLSISLPSRRLHAEDPVEKAGVVVGLTAGNMWFVPVKAISVSMGAISGALSYLVTGGNTELTKQIWRDTAAGPYLITPELARTAIGERPELDSQAELPSR